MRAALLAAVFVAAAGAQTVAGSAGAQTIDKIRAAGQLDCATVTGQEDWNGEDSHGDLSALGGEMCRAVAVAILGQAAKLAVHTMPAEPEALAALRDGTVELAMGVSPASATAMRFGIGFGPPIFYDSQRLLVSARSGITSLADLRDQLICGPVIGPAERTLRDEMTARGIPYGFQAHSELGELDASVAVRRCAAGSELESRLAQARAEFPAAAGSFVFLPEWFTLDPVVPAYRAGDARFGLIVEYTISALIEAEALGVTQANVAEPHSGMRAERLLGHDYSTGDALGLSHDWAAQVIAATGNYGEIFARTVGATLHLERGLNALWTQGGLMRPMPMQ